MGRHPKADNYKTEICVSTVCPICGKTFVPAAYHAYHAYGAQRQKRVCSYTCMIEAERRNESKKKKTGAAAHKKK